MSNALFGLDGCFSFQRSRLERACGPARRPLDLDRPLSRPVVVVVLLFALGFVPVSTSRALDLENEFRVYHEDFDYETAYLTTPEFDEVGAGGLDGSAPFPGVSTLTGQAVQWDLLASSGAFSGETTIPAGALATTSFSGRARLEGLSTGPELGVVSAGIVARAFNSGTITGVGTSLRIDWTGFGVRPVVSLAVGDVLAVINDPLATQENLQTAILSDAAVDSLISGVAFDLDTRIDRSAGTVTGSIVLSTGNAFSIGPVPLAYLGTDPLDVIVAGFGQGVGPFSTIDHSLRLDEFTLYQPFDEFYVVDSVSDAVDSNPGDGTCQSTTGECTLRAAVQESNANPGRARITFAPAGAPYVLGLAGIDEDAAAVGDLDLLDDVEIRGRGFGETIVDGDLIDRVFHVPQSAIDTLVRLSDLTVRNGRTESASNKAGGGFDSWGRTMLSRCVFETNRAGFGGALFNRRTMWLEDCLIRNNQAVVLPAGVFGGGRGGGIAGSSFGATGIDPSIVMRRVSVVDNSSEGVIGGVEFLGADSVEIEDSTFSGNTAVNAATQLQLTNSPSLLRHVTLVGGSDIGLQVGSTGTSVVVEIVNSVFEGSSACNLATNPAVTYQYSGNNASNDTSCGFVDAGSLEAAALQLGPATTSGTATVHIPADTSPLIDSADASECLRRLDQRGEFRPIDSDASGEAACEIGAVEVPEPSFGMLLLVGCGGLLLLRAKDAPSFTPRRSSEFHPRPQPTSFATRSAVRSARKPSPARA